jgi:hypothetical protein
LRILKERLFPELPTEKLTTTLSKIILRVHDKAQPQQSSTAEKWLAGPEKNTDFADGDRSRLFAGYVN